MTTGYDWYWAALEGQIGDITEQDPQLGFFRTRRGPEGQPVAIWLANDTICAQFGDGPGTDDPDAVRAMWLQCARFPIPEDDYRDRVKTGRWKSDPPAAVPHVPFVDQTAPPPAPIGHNSGAADPVADKISALLDDIAEARRFYKVHPPKTKADADKLENWRQRIFAAGKALNEARLEEGRKHREALDAIQDRYNPALNAARDCAGAKGELDTLGQTWLRAERDRLRRESEARERAAMKARRLAAEAENARILAERERLKDTDPALAALEPEPELAPVPQQTEVIVEVPTPMIGTSGHRRGVREDTPTAAITDLKAAAAYYAEIKHPDLVALIQKLANAAARSKARTKVPGCVMSWETTEKAA